MAAPFTTVVSDRRPPEEGSAPASGKDLPDDAARFCARSSVFLAASVSRTCASLVLGDEPDTRARYPFAFRLEVTYAVERRRTWKSRCESTTLGDEVLPASIGAHPAFNWPLSPELAKGEYTLTFSNEEIAPIRRLKTGLMRAAPEPTPIHGKTLALSERLFDDDAVILEGAGEFIGLRTGAGRAGRRSKCPGRDPANSEFGAQSLAARHSFASNRGAVSRVLRTSTANSPTSRG